MSSNKSAKNKLIELYGAECFIEKLHLRPGGYKEKYKSKGQYKRMKQLTFHHILEKRNNGRATVENGALLNAENHAWFHKQTPAKQAELNRIFQDYKLGILEMQNGRVVQAQVLDLDFNMDEYDVIPLQPDDRVYNRARVKRETRKALEDYWESEK